MTQYSTNRLAPVLVSAIMSLALLAGCGDGLFGGSCTAIGCLDGLSLTLDHSAGTAPADGDYTLTATDTSNSDVKTCGVTIAAGAVTSASGGCLQLGVAGGVTFEGFVPKGVTLTLSDANGTIATETLAVTYTESRPNGPDCEPTCFTKTESFNVAQ